MALITANAPWAGVGLVLVYLFKKLIDWQLHVAAARKNGCATPTKYPHKDPILGLDLFFAIVKSIQNGDTFTPDMERFRKYGRTYEGTSWGNRMIYTMDASIMQTMLTSAFDNFGVADLRYGPSVPLLGSGIFTTDGAQWEHSRNLVKPIFTRAQVSNLAPFAKHVDRMIECLPRDGSTVDLQHYFKLLFLDSSTEFIFGDSADSLLGKDSDSDAHRLRTGFDDAMRGIHKRWFLGKFKPLLGLQTQYKETCYDVHSIVDKYIEQAVQRQKLKLEKDVDDEAAPKIVLLDELIKVTDNREDIRDQCLGVFFPARDTTAISVSNIFFYLARHPKVWDKLRTEVLSIDQPLTFEYLKTLKYLRYVIQETFRLVLPAGRSLRTTLKRTVLPSGGGPSSDLPILVEPGTQIDTNFRALHRDPAIWGPDADSFRPERWEEGSFKPTWEYIPFFGGRRMCPAQQMVLTETAYVVVRMMRAFRRLENRDPVGEYVEAFIFTMESKNGVKVGLVPA